VCGDRGGFCGAVEGGGRWEVDAAGGMREGVREIMCHLCGMKPETTFDNFVGQFGRGLWRGIAWRGGGLLMLLWRGGGFLDE